MRNAYKIGMPHQPSFQSKKLFLFLKSSPAKYLISLVIVGAATMLQLFLYPYIKPAPFLFFYPAVLLACLYGDGTSAILMSAFMIEWIFSGQHFSWHLEWPGGYLRLAIFLLSAFMIRQTTRLVMLGRLRAEELVQSLEIERDLREQFVASLSHDLRNPLTAVKMSAQLVLRFPEKVDLVKIMNKIVASAERADRMVRDLLDATAIKAGQELILSKEPCDLNEIAQDVIEEKQLKFGRREIKLENKGHLQGYWNCEGVRRILENLIGNAIKYGDSEKEITVILFCDQGMAKIQVHNYGRVLSEQEKEYIFTPFGRTKSAIKSGKQGWGLGLVLVRGLAKAHGGNVTVESEPEKGTLFTVSFPVDARKTDAH